jgi:cysteine desulfurase / selenocysteine lyase
MVALSDFAKIRDDFPILKQQNRACSLIYLDNAASTQKPRQVVEAMSQFYYQDYANIHRGIYELSERATEAYEAARETVKQFIHAASNDEIIFLQGTTEGINLIAHSLGRLHWQKGDEVILSEMEHHSNIVPWYLLKERIGIELKIIPISDEGALDLEAYKKLFSARTKLVALTHVSNVLGTINPVKALTEIAHAHAVPVLLDGAQAVAHLPVNVRDIDCDYYVFSAHKLYGPTGTGVLYGKRALLAELPPFQGGGDMIEAVSFSKVSFAAAPQKFEAGTPNIAGVVGLAAAINYVSAIGMEQIVAHEQKLLKIAEEQLLTIPGLRILGKARPKVGVISFVIDGIHPHDISTILDYEGIAIRAGHHCAMPLMQRLQVPATARISFGIYNHEAEIDQFISALQTAKRLFH